MKWGILATGTIARKFVETIQQMEGEGERVVAVGSRQLETAKAFALAYQIENYYDSYEQLASDPCIDVIYVATPNRMHYENCKLCLLHGKHVLCEKPFTMRTEQAKELYELAKEKGLFLMEALWIRFLPLYKKLKCILEEGTIGELTHIDCSYGFVSEGIRRERKLRADLGGGALLDIGIYNLGFLHMVTQDMPVHLESEVHMNEYGTDDYSKLYFTYANGCIAESVQTIGKVLKRNARIVGTKGSVFLNDFQQADSMTVQQDGKGEETFYFPMDINGFEYEIRETSRCIQEGKLLSDQYTPEDSLTLTKWMEEIRFSWKQNVPSMS